jgi:hypothetical protein
VRGGESGVGEADDGSDEMNHRFDPRLRRSSNRL